MFNTLVNINLGWRKFTLCPTPKLPLVNVLRNLKCSRLDVYGQDSQIAAVPPLACNFSKVKSTPNILGLSDENGCVILFDTNKYGEEAVLKYWTAHSNAIFDLAWMENEHKMLTASGDQTVVLWDALGQQKIQTFKGHSRSVKSVCFSPSNNSIFCSGSRDGQILIYDTRVYSKDGYMKSVNAIKNAHSIGPEMSIRRNYRNKSNDNRQQSVTAVLFQTDNLLASAGAVNSTVKMWDLRKCNSLNQDPVPASMFMCSKNAMRNFGITSLALDPSLSRLFATCKDHSVYMYDSATYAREPVRVYRGYQNTSFYIKAAVSPCGRFFVSGSNDDNAYIWEVEGSEYPCITLAGHRAEVTAVAWSQHDFGKIATLSDDNTMRMWRLSCRTLPADVFELSGSATDYNHEMTPSPPPPTSTCESSQTLTPCSDSTPPFIGLKVRTPPISSPTTLSIKDWLKKSVSDWNSVNSSDNSQNEIDGLIGEQDRSQEETSPPCSNEKMKKKMKFSAKRKLECSYTAATCESSSKQRNIGNSPNWEHSQREGNSEKNPLSSKCLFPDNKQTKKPSVDIQNTPTNPDISLCERTQSENELTASKALSNSPSFSVASVYNVLRSPGHRQSSKKTPKFSRSIRKPLQKGSPESFRNQSILAFMSQNRSHN